MTARGSPLLRSVRNTVAYLLRAFTVLIGSLLTYWLVRPWLIENTVNHYAILAIWLVTTIAALHIVSLRY